MNTIFATEKSTTLFTVGKYANSPTGNYANNLSLSRVLKIPGADELEISISGSIEKDCSKRNRTCDYLAIYDGEDHEIKRYMGEINNKKLLVRGDNIRVVFKSDGKTTKKGVIVRVFKRLPANIFKEIKEKLVVATNNVLKQGTSTIYTKIIRSTNKFKGLQNKIDTIQNLDLVIDEVTDALIEVSQIYQEISSMNDAIMATHQKEFKTIETLKYDTVYHSKKLEAKKKIYLTRIHEAEKKLQKTDDNFEKQKQQFSINGYKSVINSLYAQQVIWKKFYEAQETLAINLKLYSQKISLLLHLLKISSQIYEQSANIALLRKSSILDLKDLTNLSELQDITNEIEEIEEEIREQLEHIRDTKL
ncbi:MAG: hypothetical protein KAH84_07945 [Thiomargarita sp.]|nr:hypothetical protein [Thiomargarita sp.]